MKFSDDIFDLLDINNTHHVCLTERYPISVLGSETPNALLCTVFVDDRIVPRLEGLIIDSQESVTLILDHLSSVTVSADQFPNFVRFVAQALER